MDPNSNKGNSEMSGDPPKADEAGSPPSSAEHPSRILCPPTPTSATDPRVDASLLDTYNAYLESKPVLTKALTAATVQGLGAALGSILSGPKSTETSASGNRTAGRGPRVDWLEVFAFALHGGLLNGPIGHYW
jgi:hypothetical protein